MVSQLPLANVLVQDIVGDLQPLSEVKSPAS